MTVHTHSWLGRISLAILGWQALVGPCRAEVPMEQALGLVAATLPDRRDLSPFWGMMALKSGILANIRFFGGYTSTPRQGLPPLKHLSPSDNCPQDAIAGVVEYLFPAPDGVTLAHSEYDKDPIGEIAWEARIAREGRKVAADGGLGKIRRLLEAVVAYRRQLQPIRSAADSMSLVPAGDPKAADAQALAEAGQAFRNAVLRILDRGKAGAESPEGSSFNVLRRQFAGLLQQAVLEESAGETPYPPDTVETALLAYAWKAADQVDELYGAFGGFLLGRPESKAAFDQDYYLQHWDGFLRRLDEQEHTLDGAAPLSPEDLFLFLYRQRALDSPICDLVQYRGTTYQNREYPDCGETALRNFFNIAFSRLGELAPDLVRDFLQRMRAAARMETKGGTAAAHAGELAKLEAYYEEFARLATHHSAQAHAKWSNLVSNLNRPGDPIPITYKDRQTHNLKGDGVGNMLDLVGHLLPDPVLGSPWPSAAQARHRLAAAKLDRLCELVSGKEGRWDWHVDRVKAIPGEFPVVTFTHNGVSAFQWHFRQGHFDILPVPVSDRRDDLPAKAARLARHPWLALWLRFQGPGAFHGQGPRRYPVLKRPYDIYSTDLRSPDAVQGTLEAVVAAGRAEAVPNFHLMVGRTLPFDGHVLNRLAATLRRHGALAGHGGWLPIPSLLDRPQADRDRMLEEAVRDESRSDLVALLLEHGARADQVVKGPGPLLFLALGKSPRAALELILGGADVNAKDSLGRFPLILAVNRAGRADLVEALLHAGARVDERLPDGTTALMRAAFFPGPENLATVKALVRAGADLRAEDADGHPVLWYALNPEVQKWLEAALAESPAPRAAAPGR